MPRAAGVKIDNRGTSELSDGTDSFELDDAVPVEPEFHQDLVGLLSEPRRGPRDRCGHIELHRVGDQFKFACLYYILIGPDLSVAGCLQGVLHRRPRSGERRETFTPFRESAGTDRLAEDLHGLRGVGGDLLVGVEPGVVGQLRLVDVLARGAPTLAAVSYRARGR